MADIRDYLKWRGDLDFAASPFNEVDGAILSYLAYLDMDECFREQGSGRITVPFSDAVRQYFKTHEKEEIDKLIPPFNMVPYVAEEAAKTVRFGSLTVTDYVNIIDTKVVEQMAAMVFWPDQHTAFASFRGTDNTITGWKEDFGLSYLRSTPGQKHAAEFMDRVIGPLAGSSAAGDLTVYAGGHSKGGNLAIYGTAFAEPAVRDTVKTVYANDAPGFRQEIVEEPGYRQILPKVISILPESSIIGGLLSSDCENIIIKSTETGLMQHDPLSWELLGTAFLRTVRSDLGRFFDDSTRSWISGLGDRELEYFTEALFEVLGAGGTTTVNELVKDPLKSINQIVRASWTLDPKIKDEFHQVLMRLVKCGIEALKEQGEEKYLAFAELIRPKQDLLQ
ncbi:MAG: DUF2974 domain-containing protein [Stomatobaculum sp.]|nr:DUF2974 domain-containing protein [Stomatobaculum sp.]